MTNLFEEYDSTSKKQKTPDKTLPSFVMCGSSRKEQTDQALYVRLWAACMRVGGEWLTEAKWRAMRLLPDGDEFNPTPKRRYAARQERLKKLRYYGKLLEERAKAADVEEGRRMEKDQELQAELGFDLLTGYEAADDG